MCIHTHAQQWNRKSKGNKSYVQRRTRVRIRGGAKVQHRVPGKTIKIADFADEAKTTREQQRRLGSERNQNRPGEDTPARGNDRPLKRPAGLLVTV
uniref:Uncharacterized protein n=1 Tax=Anopheles dirus TaxID=7168 RepID=A0A182NYP9_9DIPT